MNWSDIRTKLHNLVDEFVNVHEKEATTVPTVVDLGKTPNATKEGEPLSESSATDAAAVTEEPDAPPPSTTTTAAATGTAAVAPVATATSPDRLSALEGRVDAIEGGIQELLRRSAPPEQVPPTEGQS